MQGKEEKRKGTGLKVAMWREGYFRKGGETEWGEGTDLSADTRHAKGKREGSARTCQWGHRKGKGRRYSVPEGGTEPMGGIVMMGGTIFNVDSTMCLDEIVRLLLISSGSSYLLSGLNSYLSPY